MESFVDMEALSEHARPGTACTAEIHPERSRGGHSAARSNPASLPKRVEPPVDLPGDSSTSSTSHQLTTTLVSKVEPSGSLMNEEASDTAAVSQVAQYLADCGLSVHEQPRVDDRRQLAPVVDADSHGQPLKLVRLVQQPRLFDSFP